MKATFSARVALLAAGILWAGFWSPRVARAASIYVPFNGEKTTWHDGFERYDYLLDEASFAITPFKRPDSEKFAVGGPPKGQRRCIVVVPQQAAPGHAWSWQGCYWDHQPQAEVELLRRGFHIAFITPDPGRQYPGKQWDAWYAYLTEKHGLSTKPPFVGMSKGGVNEYTWAGANPDKVSCIYADNPGIYPEDIPKIGELIKHDVPLLNVCGTEDFVLEKNTKVIENIYHQGGGQISIMIKEGMGHHPHSLIDPKPSADFIEQHVQPNTTPRPEIVDDTFTKSYYYSTENSYVYLAKEDTYAACRGPQFTPCYDRYDKAGKSSFGVTSMAVLVPKIEPAGKPWVFRADRIGRDASVIDLALLAKAGVPILHVCGSLDPWLDRDTRVAEKKYKELGGNFTVIVRQGEGHLATGPQDPKPVVDFIVAKTN